MSKVKQFLKETDRTALENLKKELREKEREESPEDIEQELRRQAQLLTSGSGLFLLDSLAGPDAEDGTLSHVPIEYMGKLKYVSIEFESLEGVDPKEFERIAQALKELTRKGDTDSTKARKLIESYQDTAVDIVFQHARLFDFSHEESRESLEQLLRKLCIRSYKARTLILALLKGSRSINHLRLAIRTAGLVREVEAVPYLISHATSDARLFTLSVDAIFQIRTPESVPFLLKLIGSIDLHQKDLLETVYHKAADFHVFGPTAIPLLLEALLASPRYDIKPIWLRALNSFGDEVIPAAILELPKLLEEPKGFGTICGLLGRAGNQVATEALTKAYEQYPNRRREILDGLGHVKDWDTTLPLFVQVLKEGNDDTLVISALNAVAFCDNPLILPYVARYTSHTERNVYLNATFVLARFGDKEALHQLIHYIIDGSPIERHVVEKFISKLKPPQILKMAEHLMVLPSDQAVLLLMALNRPRILPRKVGSILHSLLQDPKTPVALQLEIYRLLAKHVKTRHELLPVEVIFAGLFDAQDPRLKRELENIRRSLPSMQGELTVVEEDSYE